MNNRLHTVVGTSVAVAAALYLDNSSMLLGIKIIPALSIVTAAVGSSLPDSDLYTSKLGKNRIRIGRTLQWGGLLLAVASLVLTIYVHFLTPTLPENLALVLRLMFFPILAIGTIGWLLGIFVVHWKHRGITHTLLFPAAILILYIYLGKMESNNVIVVSCSLLYGLFIGYVMHIFADMFNGKGCPVLWPISRNRISFMDMKYGGFGEKILLVIFVLMPITLVVLKFI